jgi:hypothetical protein
MPPKANIPPVEERNESFMHKLAKEKLAEWLNTEDDVVVEEYPIVPYFCGTWDSNWVHELEGLTKLPGGWYRGPTFDAIKEKPPIFNGESCYPVAICDVFTYSSGKIPEAKEIWEVRHTHSVTPVKRKAILDCYSEGGNSGPHLFEVDAFTILGFDAKIKPKDALRKLRLTTKDLNPAAELTPAQWKQTFQQEDREEYERDLEKRFEESDEYKKCILDIETLQRAKKNELDLAAKTLNLKGFLDRLFEPYMMNRYHDIYEKEKDTHAELDEAAAKPGNGLFTFFKTRCSKKSDDEPVHLAESILKNHLDSMLPSKHEAIRMTRKTWLENNTD